MKFILLFVALYFCQNIFSQSVLPLIKANSKKVAIKDDGYLDKNAWSLAPAIRPDVYTADRTRKSKWVVFYTDIDSVKVKVKPGSRFNFIVLLNGKDSCYTQIASAIPPEDPAIKNIVSHDTIPFTLTAFNAIHVKAMANDTALLNLHFDLSSFDFQITKDALSNKIAKIYKLQMGGMIWNKPPVGSTKFTAREMDGRFGWNLFEGKAVEIDYDKSILIIHSKMPEKLKGYNKSTLLFVRSLVAAEAFCITGNKKVQGNFIFDTGSDQAMIADSGWAAAQNLNNLPLVKSTTLRDPRGVQYETRTVLLPQFQFAGFVFNNVPTLVLTGKNPMGVSINYLGNDLLKRFNMMLDFKHDLVYLKPNKLFDLPFKEHS